MKLLLTDGMDGAVVISVLKESKDTDEILNAAMSWKSDPENKKKYKIENYDRMIFSSDEKTVFVDFGDYMTFFAIVCETQDEYSALSEAITGKNAD